MADPWLTLIGLGEDGLDGLSSASRHALDAAEFVFGGPRHLALAGVTDCGRPWPVPFDTAPVLACRGARVVVLASGDPFWFGAGGSLLADLAPGEWVSHPATASFQLAANRLGWRMEDLACVALHAAPFAQLRARLGQGQRLLCTLRDGAAAADLARWLTDKGAGAARLWLMEALGGPRERIRSSTAQAFDIADAQSPALVALDLPVIAGLARRMTPGLPDDQFSHDGQITKQPIRALTLCTLAPRAGERLWDLGAGSGSVAVEWCLQGGHAVAVEARADRVANIRANIDRFGLSTRMQVVEARLEAHLGADRLPAPLASLPPPDAIFIGGGGDAALLETLQTAMPPGVRLVMNAVTLETEALVVAWQAKYGGDLMRIDIARATPLGRLRGWTPSRPVVQWSVTL